MYDILHFCAICGNEVPYGEGEKFLINERPIAWLCSQCDELYWLWELRESRPIYNDTQYHHCYELQRQFKFIKGW